MCKFLTKKLISHIICFILLAAIILSAIFMTFSAGADAEAQEKISLEAWQIDSFEGGKGSRADFLQSLANDFSKEYNCYITVTRLSADAARLNIENGTIPDLISYGAGMYGLEGILGGDKPYYTWAHGGYCFITLENSSDFSDISAENTIINSGTDNLADVTALFCGIEDATYDVPTGAYVKLINGKYKYLLGTQRDIYRLKTRGVSFMVKPIVQFNDLYQNISITSACKNVSRAKSLIEYIISNADLTKIGLMGDSKLYDDEMSIMEGISYEFRLISPVSLKVKDKINSAIKNRDIKTLKTLLI